MSDRVQRSYLKGWRDKTSGGWTRRARWFEGRTDEGMTIRLCFEERDVATDERVTVNCYYDNAPDAHLAMQMFVDGASARSFRD